VIRHGRKTGFRDDPWLAELMARKPADRSNKESPSTEPPKGLLQQPQPIAAVRKVQQL